jgi:methylmalonyl-CoA mutase N-terminal domain/subunit
MRQYSGFGTAAQTNRRYKMLLEKGQTGLSIAFDLPTQMGLDPDDPMSQGEVGKTGVSISTLKDMEELLDGIPLGEVTISMTINATALILFAMYIALAQKRGISLDSLSGTVQNDILKEYIARGCYIFPPEPSLKLTIDLIEYALRYTPRWNFISVSGYHMREAGATAAQELGFTFSNAICYLKEASGRRLDLNLVGRRTSFFFGVHNNFLEEVAKFRAARRIWAKITRETFKMTDPLAMGLRFHAQTSGSTLTAQQPQNNIVRVTLQALAAVLGGVQSLHTNALDEAIALPTDRSQAIALRTQQIIGYETGITEVIDPLGGSYYVEALTDKLEAEAFQYIAQVDRIGGAVQAIEQAYYQQEIERSAVQDQQRIEGGQRVVVGVNRFVDEEEGTPIAYLKVDPAVQQDQIQRLKEIRNTRNSREVKFRLEGLLEAAGQGRNLVPAILECVKAYASIGEICEALRGVYGSYRET